MEALPAPGFRARIPAKKKSSGVRSFRLIRKLKSRRWLRKQLATALEHQWGNA